jgi:MarR family transcriptional regulator, temperature-dependent positive regulator of motility
MAALLTPVPGRWCGQIEVMGQAAGSPGTPPLPAPPELLAAPGYVIRRLHQAYVAAWVRRVDPVLTGPQGAVLVAIHAYPGVDQGSLARAVSLDRSTMASIARRLEDRGLITRETPPEDGRKRVLRLTTAGETARQEVSRKADELHLLLMEGYDGPETDAMLNRLLRLTEHWESLVDD